MTHFTAPDDGSQSRSTRLKRSSFSSASVEANSPQPKKRKAGTACLFCRRSHMTCDDIRPCSRCIRREIGHLCRDEPANTDKKRSQRVQQAAALPDVVPLGRESTRSNATMPLYALSEFPLTASDDKQQQPLRNEFHGPNLSDFLRSFDDPTLFANDEPLVSLLRPVPAQHMEAEEQNRSGLPVDNAGDGQEPSSALPTPSKNELYLMTAADQKDGPRNERLARVIHAKYEAGLLKPFDYVAGYKRLSRWMETHARHVISPCPSNKQLAQMSVSSRQRTLQTISEFRAAFRSTAASLTDLDLVFAEEEFERLLLDCDRMFANMPVPACLWRRTGEIFKVGRTPRDTDHRLQVVHLISQANVEFAQLVGVPIEHLKDGKLAIYELMAAGESAGNYWERYGRLCFDIRQKTAMTNCVLQNQASRVNLPCTFSFTIRRDSFDLPNAVVGNFLPG